MIIRSQDKEQIVNLNNIDSICIEPNYCGWDVMCYNGTQESCVKFGEYSTKEKAIKVLDMIQGAYVKCEALKSLSSGTMFEVAKVMNEEQSKEFTEVYKSNFVFEMPQDSEV